MNPLDQLADISTPTNVSIWPLAWGYWVLIALLLGILTILIFWLIKVRKHGVFKRQTLAQLAALQSSDTDFAQKAQVYLKQTCLHYFSQAKPLQLSGIVWQQFILSHYKGKQEEELKKAVSFIQNSLYANSSIDNTTSELNESTKQALLDWIKTSTPPRKERALVTGTADV